MSKSLFMCALDLWEVS